MVIATHLRRPHITVRPPWRGRAPAVNSYLVDGALAVALAVVAVLFDARGPDLRADSALVWDVVLVAPLVFRRRAPASVMAVLACLCLVQWLVDVRAIGDLAFLVALYTVAAHARQRWLLPTAIVTAEGGVVMVVLRWATGHSQLITGVLLTGTVTAAWTLGIAVRTRRDYLASVLDRAETAERERDSRAQIAVTEERVRIAREMHDIIAHSLSIMITLNDAAAAADSLEQARNTVRQGADVGRSALSEMQLMLNVLRSDATADRLPQPGAAQLNDLIDIVRAAGLSVHLTVTGDLTALPATAQLAIYRIVQESLTNTVKHARNASRVSVTITRHRGHVSIAVTNDGDIAERSRRDPGHGLAGMQERAELYGGRIQAAASPGGGWSVQATLVLAAPATNQ